MSRGTWILAAVAVVAVATSLWLYRDNRALRRELGVRAVPAADKAPRSLAIADLAEDVVEAAPAKRGGLRSFFRLGGDRTPPTLDPPKKETRAERRVRWQERIRAMLGRMEDETAEEYRDRVAPFITAGLARPRSMVDEARRDAEEAAGVTSEQSVELDEIFDDAYAEALELTNQAVASGELTPYDRNVSGVLQFAGGIGAVFGTAESRYDEVLSPEQRSAMAGAGFDLGDYLGATAPWEQLDPPPPPGGDG